MAEDLPVISGLTETAEDAEPLVVRAMNMIAKSRRTAGDEYRVALASMERAYDKESDPEVRNRYRMVLADLHGMEKKGAGQGDSLGARRVRSSR